jgi:hypothetical protein
MEGIIKLDNASVCVYYISVEQKITFKHQLDCIMAKLMEPA